MYKSLKKIFEEENLNLSCNKYGIIKSHYKMYVDLFYEEYCFQLKGKKINLLENSLRHRALHYLWSNYFKKGSRLVLDNYLDSTLIKNPTLQKWFQRKNIKIIIYDAYSKNVFQEINSKLNTIIDDRQNIESQIISIFSYIPRFKKNIFFIIEDLLRGYITCLFLKLITLFKSKFKIFNFRKHKLVRDIIFSYIKRKLKNFFLVDKIFLIFECILLIPEEIFI